MLCKLVVAYHDALSKDFFDYRQNTMISISRDEDFAEMKNTDSEVVAAPGTNSRM